MRRVSWASPADPLVSRLDQVEGGTKPGQQLHRVWVCVCICVCVLAHGVGRLRSCGLHRGQMCNAVHSASVLSSPGLILLQVPHPRPFEPLWCPGTLELETLQ